MEGTGNMTQLSLKEAKRLSIIKWEAHVKAGGECKQMPIETSFLKNRCGFCERYRDSDEDYGLACYDCEFGKLAGWCNNEDESDLYSIWCDRSNVENAQSILNIIKSIPDE